jgi:co-chaperonin GroES (HSP10)
MKPYIFRYRELDPTRIQPIGDRYMVEILDTDEASPAGILLLERSEQGRGWVIGVVFSSGNGHRLDTPDQVVVVPEPTPRKGETSAQGFFTETETDEDYYGRLRAQANYSVPVVTPTAIVTRVQSTVPMYCRPGEVIFVERHSGREFNIGERTFRFVNQVDVLGTSGRFLNLQADGGWEEAAPAPVPQPNGKPQLHSA